MKILSVLALVACFMLIATDPAEAGCGHYQAFRVQQVQADPYCEPVQQVQVQQVRERVVVQQQVYQPVQQVQVQRVVLRNVVQDYCPPVQQFQQFQAPVYQQQFRQRFSLQQNYVAPLRRVGFSLNLYR